jgi:drug/metabolite transporter (DMT)-like permease
LDDKASKSVNRRETLLAWGAALVTVTLWASAFVGIRVAGEGLSPGALSLARLLVGSTALGTLVLVRREPSPARRALPAIALCGTLWFGLYNVVLNSAERLVDAGTAAMLVGIAPVLIAGLAGGLLGEGYPRSLFAGCAVALAGVTVIGLATSGRGFDGGLGAALCLVAAFAYASGVVIEKPLLGRASGLQVTWLACSVGAVACLPFAPALVREIGGAGAQDLGWTV